MVAKMLSTDSVLGVPRQWTHGGAAGPTYSKPVIDVDAALVELVVVVRAQTEHVVRYVGLTECSDVAALGDQAARDLEPNVADLTGAVVGRGHDGRAPRTCGGTPRGGRPVS